MFSCQPRCFECFIDGRGSDDLGHLHKSDMLTELYSAVRIVYLDHLNYKAKRLSEIKEKIK